MLLRAQGWVPGLHRMILVADYSPNGLSHPETSMILANVA
jgi:hypothetical protein